MGRHAGSDSYALIRRYDAARKKYLRPLPLPLVDILRVYPKGSPNDCPGPRVRIRDAHYVDSNRLED